MWLDPASRQYVIILTNRVHPSGKGSVVELRRRISAAVGARLRRREASRRPPRPIGRGGEVARSLRRLPGRTLTGLDRLVAENFARLAGRSVGLVTNQTGIDARGRRGHRPARRSAGREAAGDLLARARARRQGRRQCAARARRRHRSARVEPLRADATALVRDARGHRHASSSTSRTWARATTPISPRSCTCWRRRGAEASR